MSADQEREDSGYKVRDRRRLNEDAVETPSTPREEPVESPRALPEIDFTTFIASLATSAMLHLGMIPDPDSQQPETNLPLAKQTIDILGMLQTKTQGNLTASETTVLQRLLYDLRMQYLEASRPTV